MNHQQNNAVIRLAWEDRTSFEDIEKRTGLSESEVIKLMRSRLRPSSFRLWRQRVSGRVTKHGRRFRQSRDELKQLSTRSILENADEQ